MTTGSWSTLKDTYVYTGCGASSNLKNGTTVSWSGGDRVTKLRPRRVVHSSRDVYTFKPQDEVFFEYRLGRWVPKRKVDYTQYVQGQDFSKGVLEWAEVTRLKSISEPDGSDDYSTPHAFSKTWTTYQQSVFTWVDWNGVRTGTVNSCGFGQGNVSCVFDAADQYKLISRLREKVTGSDFNLASFLGAEGKDTVTFLASTANRIYRSMLAMKKADVAGAIRILRNSRRVRADRSTYHRDLALQKDVYQDLLDALSGRQREQKWATVPASQWLEYHLAVEPLLSDTWHAAQFLGALVNKPLTQSVSASIKKTAYAGPPPYYGGAIWATNFRALTRRIVAYFKCAPNPAAFLGFQDPEVVLWNALPLSFVSDYMYDIGGFLEARATRAAFGPGLFVQSDKNWRFARGLQFWTYTRKIYGTVVPEDGRRQVFSEGAFNRQILTSLDVPTPDFKPLGAFKSWQRALTTISLAALAGSGSSLLYTRG